MSYRHTQPKRIEIGSEFVTVLPTEYGSTQTARILRRVDADDGEPVHLILDRLIGDAGTEFLCDAVTWKSAGCVASELHRA